MPVSPNGLPAIPSPSEKKATDIRTERWLLAGFIGVPVILLGLVCLFIWAAIDDDRNFVARQTQQLKSDLVSERMDAVLKLGSELSRIPKRAEEIAATAPVLVEFLGDDTAFQWNTIHAGMSFPTGSVTTPAKEADKLLVRLGALAVPALIDALNNYEWSDDSLLSNRRREDRLRELSLQFPDAADFGKEIRRRRRIGQQACQTLVRIAHPARAPVIAALHDQRWAVRAGAAVTLAVFADRQFVALLESAIKDEDASVREAVVISLGRLAGPNAVTPLITALGSELKRTPLEMENLLVIKAAATTLASLRDPRAIEPLITAFESVKGKYMATAVHQSLIQLVHDTLPSDFPKGAEMGLFEPKQWREWWNGRDNSSGRKP